MKQLKNLSIFMLVALISATFASCSKDDDNAVFDLNSYIIGSWHSYKGTIYITGGQYGGNSQDVEISKTGQLSQSYFEFTFQNAGRVKMGAYQKDDNGVMNWQEENGTYRINGDIVTLTDADGVSVNVVFNTKDRTLCLQGAGTNENGIPYKVSIYMKK